MKVLFAAAVVLCAVAPARAELVNCHVLEDGAGPVQWLAFDTEDPWWNISPELYEWRDQDYRVEINRATGAVKAKQRGFGLMQGTCTFVAPVKYGHDNATFDQPRRVRPGGR